MKKVINITLGGIVFAIEQDAYDSLSQYIEAIKQRLGEGEDGAEIMQDIEGAIAEKFTARKRSEKLAVSVSDVSEVTKEMGKPSDFGEDNVDTKGSESETTNTEARKRLYRDTDGAVIAGVASGIAQYFEIDPVIVRLIFVVSIFFSGIGILVYIIFWLVVPAAETTAQKYAMRGDRVTLKEISDRVKKNLEGTDIKKARGAWTKMRGFLQEIFSLLGKLMRGMIYILRYVVGLWCVLVGALTMAVLVSTYSVVIFSDKVLFPSEVQTALHIMLGSTVGIIAVFSSFVMMIIPLQVLIMIGTSLLAGRNFFNIQKVVSLGVVWIVAVVVAFSTSALQVEQVMKEIGPIEGRFNESNFEVHFQNLMIKGDHDNLWFVSYEDKENDSDSDSDSEYEYEDGYADPEESEVACTLEAMMCPDGSFVGRTGPDCEFAECSVVLNNESISCSEEMKNVDVCDDMYSPVCGLVEVQCVTAPCPPIEENFGNACSACSRGNVDSYTEGACSY